MYLVKQNYLGKAKGPGDAKKRYRVRSCFRGQKVVINGVPCDCVAPGIVECNVRKGAGMGGYMTTDFYLPSISVPDGGGNYRVRAASLPDGSPSAGGGCGLGLRGYMSTDFYLPSISVPDGGGNYRVRASTLGGLGTGRRRRARLGDILNPRVFTGNNPFNSGGAAAQPVGGDITNLNRVTYDAGSILANPFSLDASWFSTQPAGVVVAGGTPATSGVGYAPRGAGDAAPAQIPTPTLWDKAADFFSQEAWSGSGISKGVLTSAGGLLVLLAAVKSGKRR